MFRDRASREELLHLLDDLLAEREETARRLSRLTESLQTLDARLLTVENSRIFRSVQTIANLLRTWGVKSKRYVSPSHAEAVRRRAYHLWLDRQRMSAPSNAAMRETVASFAYSPVFSFLMHVCHARRDRLEASVDSVLRQSYSRWELCVCDDASPGSWSASYFQSLAAADSRIQYVRSEQVMGAASSLNRAGMLGGGDYFAPFGEGGILSQHALFYLASALQEKRFDLLYCDEDCLTPTGLHERPSFKPAWSPELLTTSMYLGRFFAISRTAMDCTGWFRQEFEGAHLYDVALRIAERSSSIHRVAQVLYGEEEAAPRRETEKRALQAAIQRRGWQASVEDAQDARFTIRRKLEGTPLASIVICSRNAGLLRNCLRSIDNLTAYPVRETVVVQHKTGDDGAMERLLARSHCIRVTHSGPFDFASMNNRGAQAANGEVLVFLNDDVEPLSADWLKELLAQLQRPEVGVVGGKLLYPSGAIQHAGIALGLMDGAGHPDRGGFGQGFWKWSSATRNVSAVTGACLAIRRRVFDELRGFDTCFPVNYNDVDLCLRARQAGYQVVCENAALLRHQESKTRVQGVSWQERELFHDRWGKLIELGDPYYSPHLTRMKEDCSLA